MTTITMELVCRVQANPITSPTWFRIVRNISREVDRGTRVVKRGEMVSVVIIPNPQNLHLGEYICRANNSLGEDSRTIIVQGRVPPYT